MQVKKTVKMSRISLKCIFFCREKIRNVEKNLKMSGKKSEYQEKKSSIHLKYNFDNKRDISRLKSTIF